MQHIRTLRRPLLLAIALLSACAAADPSPAGAPPMANRDAPSPVFGEYLAGRFARSQGDAQTAATQFLNAVAQAVLEEATVKLGYTTIRSPVKGFILDRRI